MTTAFLSSATDGKSITETLDEKPYQTVRSTAISLERTFYQPAQHIREICSAGFCTFGRLEVAFHLLIALKTSTILLPHPFGYRSFRTSVDAVTHYIRW